MEIAVTITKTQQISYDEFKDFHYTKIFDDTATLKEINEWTNTIDQSLEIGILSARLSKVTE